MLVLITFSKANLTDYGLLLRKKWYVTDENGLPKVIS